MNCLISCPPDSACGVDQTCCRKLKENFSYAYCILIRLVQLRPRELPQNHSLPTALMAHSRSRHLFLSVTHIDRNKMLSSSSITAWSRTTAFFGSPELGGVQLCSSSTNIRALRLLVCPVLGHSAVELVIVVTIDCFLQSRSPCWLDDADPIAGSADGVSRRKKHRVLVRRCQPRFPRASHNFKNYRDASIFLPKLLI